ncbi:glycosyltransferase [Aerolutibacter ruishenii]|uniref:Glycosyltransferase involved in cell wall biosynthesis n=1 Tax=Aerolutibacter ruishenii TaxID=686800 RepID=A0A562LCQ5_9GAMM|nr:glycosyltransferase [Lysobacter ruishenii]TWI05346.1 glycosyltransferase involved in cell wall biosynthesis [Lysobacter ruishenii]
MAKSVSTPEAQQPADRLAPGNAKAMDHRQGPQPVPSPPLRVLYVVSLFPSLSETFIAREIHALIEGGIDVRILSLKPPTDLIVQPLARSLLDRVLHPANWFHTVLSTMKTVARNPALMMGFSFTVARGLWRHPMAMLKSIAAITLAMGRLEDIRAYGPKLIHAPWATYPATVAWILSRLMDLPFSFTSRAHDIFVRGHLMPGKLANAALAVTITEHNVRYMNRWMPTPGAVPIQVIHSALNLNDLHFVTKGRAPARLLSVGRLVPQKGFDVLLRAIAILRSRGTRLECTIIGEGVERAKLESLRASLDLVDAVDLPGGMPNDVVINHMSSASIMVLPCVVAPDGSSDGIPNVLMEAMATGLPVISTSISGIPELVEDGVSGRLVPAGDANALADAIQSMIDDPLKRERFAMAGRKKVEREFDVRVEAGRLLKHFLAVCHA